MIVASAASSASSSSSVSSSSMISSSTPPRSKNFTPRPPTLPKQPSIGSSSASAAGSAASQNGAAGATATNGASSVSTNTATASPAGSSNSLPQLRAAPSSASSAALLPPSSAANPVSPPSKLSVSAASPSNGNGSGAAAAPSSGGNSSSATSSPAVPLRKKSIRVPAAIDLPSASDNSAAAAASAGASSPRPAPAALHTPLTNNAATLTPLPASVYSTTAASVAPAAGSSLSLTATNGQQLQPLALGVQPVAAVAASSYTATTNPSPLGSAYDEVKIPISFPLPASEPPASMGAAPALQQSGRESAFVSVPIAAPIAAASSSATVFAANGLPSAHQSVPLPASFHLQGGGGGGHALMPSTPVPYASPSPSHAAAANLPHLLIPGSPALPPMGVAATGQGTPSSPAAPNGGQTNLLPFPSAAATDAAPVTGVSMNSKQWAQLLYRYRAGDTPTPGSGNAATAAAAARAGLSTPASSLSPSLLHSDSLSTPPLHSPNALGTGALGSGGIGMGMRPSSRTRSRQMNRKLSEVDQVASASAAASGVAAVAATPAMGPLQAPPQQHQQQQQQQPVMDAEKFAMQNELNRLRAVIAMQTHAAASASQQQQHQQQQPQQSTPQHFPSPQLPHHQQQHLAHLYAPSPIPSPSSGPGLSWNTAFAAMSNSMSMQHLAATAAAAAAAAAASPSPQPLAHASGMEQQPVFSSLPSPMIAPSAAAADVNASQQDHRNTFRSMSMLIRSGSAAQHHHPSSSQLHSFHHAAQVHHMHSAVPSMGSLVRSRSAEDSAHFSSGSSPHPTPAPYQQHSALSVMVGSSSAASTMQQSSTAAPQSRAPTIVVTEIEEEEPVSARPPPLVDHDEDADTQPEHDGEIDADSAELDAMTEVAEFLARNDAPASDTSVTVDPPLKGMAEEAAQLQGLNDHAVASATSADAKSSSATSSPTSPSSAATTAKAVSSTLVAPAATASSSRVASRKSPRSIVGGACTNPSCAERLATQRTELWKLLSAKTTEEKDAVARVARAAEQRLHRELAVKDARIQALEKTQTKLLSSSGGAAKVLQSQVDELQSMVARLRAQVESLGGVPLASQSAVASSADASTATSTDEPDATSVPEDSSSSSSSLSHGRRAAILTVDAGSDSSSSYHQPASPLPQLMQQPDQPFFNTSAPRTVHSKATKGNTRRRSASFGSNARMHTVAAAAATSAHAAATAAAPAASASASSTSLPKAVSTDSAHPTARSDAKAPSRPMASNPQSGLPIRARANSLRTAAEATSSNASAGLLPPTTNSSGIHASLQAASPSRSVRKNSRSRPNNAPGTPVTAGGSAAAAAASSSGGLSVSGTAVDSGTPKQRPSFSMNVRPQPQSQQQLPPSGATAVTSHASAPDSLPSSLSPTASHLASSRDHSPGSLTLPSAVAGED